jgi:uncharacterized UBP type Zn finger protein
MSISCALDLYPYWLGIVLDYLVSAERIHAEVVEAWRSPDDERLGRAQEEEFVACMQCIMAFCHRHGRILFCGEERCEIAVVAPLRLATKRASQTQADSRNPGTWLSDVP